MYQNCDWIECNKIQLLTLKFTDFDYIIMLILSSKARIRLVKFCPPLGSGMGSSPRNNTCRGKMS